MADSAPLGKREKQRRSLRGTLKHYWFEISVTFLFATGIFLLVERFKIKDLVYGFMVSSLSWIVDGFRWLWGATLSILGSVEKSDIVGVVLLFIATCMIVHRGRLRAIRRHPDMDQLEGCPECDGALERVRRTSRDRIAEFALWINIRRYACTKCTFRHSSWLTKA